MKHLLLFVMLLVAEISFSQVNKSSRAIFRLQRDEVRTNAGSLANIDVQDDADAIVRGLHKAGSTQTLYLPEGIYLIKKSIALYTSGLSIKGAGIGKTIVRFDDSYLGTTPLFQSNGVSDLTIEGITFTGNAKEIKAVIEFNSYPKLCKNINLINCEFINVWAKQAINFGGMSAGETHSNDNVVIDHCRFYNIFNPSYKIVTNDTDPKCDAINLQQTTLRASIRYCSFQNISGDGIFGWGWSGKNVNPAYGNWNIHHNVFFHCWMGIEVNGGGLGNGLYIHDNSLKYSTRDGGYLISVDSYKARIINNKLYNNDRGLIEYTAIEGTISGNTGVITTYKQNSGAVRVSVKWPRIACVELYGYNNIITRNKFTLNRAGPDTFSPDEFNGIKLIGKTTDLKTQPLSYKGITDFSAYWKINHNTVTGFTHKAIDATGDKIRNVDITDNVFSSRWEQASPVEIYGYQWNISKNTFNLEGTLPAENSYVVGVFYLQKDSTASVVSSNIILGNGWNSSHHKYAGNIR